jgi:putative hemolysin
LAAAQIGVTLCGFLSAALGAEKIGTHLIPKLRNAGLSEGAANLISLVGITLVIAYISLVFGELVPKRLALYKTESIALASASTIDPNCHDFSSSYLATFKFDRFGCSLIWN